MAALRVQLTRFIDEPFPGLVEFQFVDTEGRVHRFAEKAPVVSAETLSTNGQYPRPGQIACVIGAERRDEAGRSRVEITTARPWGIVSIEGASDFEVFASDILSRDG